jgi:hypothetical protein
MLTIRLAIAWAALSGLLPTIALAQEVLRPAELQRLSFYVGKWSEAGQMRDDPAKPFKPIAGGNLHAVGQIEGNRWIWVTDPATDGSRLRYTFAPSLQGARTLMVEAGTDGSWSPIANIKYAVRK